MVESNEAFTEIARIRNLISELIEQNLESKDFYYLSRLGVQLGDQRLLLEKYSGMKLANFVRENFSEQYEIGLGGLHSNVLYLRKPGTVSATSTSPTPRYIPRFWAAFAIPLRQGEVRAINLDTCDFGHKERIESGTSDVRLIEAEFVAPEGASGSAGDTAMRISNWLVAQGLDGERFHLKARRSLGSETSLLAHLLSILDKDQLRRVSLPLDVIKALADHGG